MCTVFSFFTKHFFILLGVEGTAYAATLSIRNIGNAISRVLSAILMTSKGTYIVSYAFHKGVSIFSFQNNSKQFRESSEVHLYLWSLLSCSTSCPHVLCVD
eukprot:Trichotokara_eunicae@DN11271_c0_g1_i1.p1